MKRIEFLLKILVLFIFFSFYSCNEKRDNIIVQNKRFITIQAQWKKMFGDKKGKLIFAKIPYLYILYLPEMKIYKLPNIKVEGGKGRFNRGKTPRPFWSTDGKRFVFRNSQGVFVSNEKGETTKIINSFMDTSIETRWSWMVEDKINYVVGPTLKGGMIAININNNNLSKQLYQGNDIKYWCEITGDKKYIVYYDKKHDIRVVKRGSKNKGILISKGQSCRPVASPNNIISYLNHSHDEYLMFMINDKGLTPLPPLKAPKEEELYRFNWSNLSDYGVHMFGSRGNSKITIREISSNKSIYVLDGWDPDLWIEN